MKKIILYFLIAAACICCVVTTIFLPFFFPAMVGGIAGSVERHRIRSEVFEFILENKDTIEADSPHENQAFHYTSTGFSDAGVNFGYYYSAEDNHLFIYDDPLWGSTSGDAISPDKWATSYRKGLRVDEVYGDPLDWYYTEKICNNWYYYELHDG